MANIKDFTSSSINQLLEDGINEFPDELDVRSDSAELRANMDTLAGVLHNHLSHTFGDKLDKMSEKEVLNAVISTYDKIKKNDSYNTLFTNFDSTSSKLGHLILTSFNTLKYDIHPEVESLKLSFDARVHEIVDSQRRKRSMLSEDHIEEDVEGSDEAYDNENFEELDDTDIEDTIPSESTNIEEGTAEIDTLSEDSNIIDRLVNDTTLDAEIDKASDETAEAIADETENFVEDIKESFDDDTTDESNTDDSQMCLFEWDKLFNKFGGINTITDMYKDMTGYTSNGNFSDTTLALNITKPHIEKINLHPDMQEDINNRLEKIGNEIDREYLTHVFKLCTDPYEFDRFFDRHLYRVESTNNPAKLLQINSKALSKVYPYLTKLSKIPFNISEELSDKIHQNIKVVENMFWVMANQVLAFRKHYKEALVISHNLINSDTYNEYRHNGGTNQDIINHLKVNFNKRNIYPSGLSSEEIVSNKIRNANMLKDMKKQIAERKKEIKNKLYFTALRDVLYNHLRTTPPDQLPEGMNLDNFIDLKMSLINVTLDKYVASDTPNIEQLLYKFILGLRYEGTIVEKTHDLFNKSIAKQLSLKNKITKEDLKMVDIEVGAKLASEFITKNIFQY